MDLLSLSDHNIRKEYACDSECGNAYTVSTVPDAMIFWTVRSSFGYKTVQRNQKEKR